SRPDPDRSRRVRPLSRSCRHRVRRRRTGAGSFGCAWESPVVDRREFITVAGSLVAACVASSLGRAARATAPPASEAAERLNALFDGVLVDELHKESDSPT